MLCHDSPLDQEVSLIRSFCTVSWEIDFESGAQEKFVKKFQKFQNRFSIITSQEICFISDRLQSVDPSKNESESIECSEIGKKTVFEQKEFHF